MISNISKNFPGHVFVDAYDPETDSSYLLDANWNVMIEMPSTEGKSLVQSLIVKRKYFAENAKVYTFPVYFRYVDPGETAYFTTPLTVNLLNALLAKREDTWRSWIASDLVELYDWWNKAPGHKPRTIADIRKAGLSNRHECFNLSGDYAARINAASSVAPAN
jgi:hypothetical protein